MGAKWIRHPLHNRTIYIAWMDMKKRCLIPTNKFYPIYGWKGVKIFDPWINNYEMFLEWAVENGWQKGLQLDKDIKGDGMLYSPETCCWATPRENANERSTNINYDYNGEMLTLREIGRRTGIHDFVLYGRIKNGMSLTQAISIPVKPKADIRYFYYKGETRTIKQIAEMENLDYQIFRGRLKYYKYENIEMVVNLVKTKYNK